MRRPWWHDARAEMLLDPTVANLNTGSFGPVSRPVFDRVTQLRHRLAEEPMAFLLREAPPLLWDSRTRFAEYLGADRRRLVFTSNVTASINIVAGSLMLAAPGEILMTDHEYGAMQWAWERAAQRARLTVRTFALPPDASSPNDIVEAAVEAMTPRTRVLFFSHVLSPTGMILPARKLCAEARRRGILSVVDGAHAPGFIPLNLDEIGADFYGANAHKWLLASTGCGFLYLGIGSAERIRPLQVSWGYEPDRGSYLERDEFGSTPRIRQFEFEGTRDPCPWIVVPDAIDFQAKWGLERIRKRIRELVRFVRERIDLPLVTPTHREMHGAMTAFRLPVGTDAEVFRKLLWEQRIELNIVERPDELLARVSTHFYNTEEEVDRLASVLPELLSRAR